MSYTPINIGVYVAAYSGAIAGMTTSGWLTDSNQSDYALVTSIASSYAQEFDTVWNNSATLNTLEQQCITAIVSNIFIGRAPGPLNDPIFQTPSNWTINVTACKAIVLESDAFFASQGIVPPFPSENSNGGSAIRLAIGISELTTSNTLIPSGDVVSSIVVNVESAYSENATITVTCNGQTLMFSDGVDLQNTGLYSNPIDVIITSGAVVEVSISNAPATGSCAVTINYFTPED